MNTITSISLNDPTAKAIVLAVPGGEFIALQFAEARVSIYLDGYNAAAVASARAIIGALQTAIAQIETAPAPTPALSMTYADGAA